VILLVAFFVYRYVSSYESTDDAQVDGHINSISTRIAGNVVKLNVQDNQYVEAGTVLLEIDPADYQVAYQRAKADFEDAQAAAAGAGVNVPITSVSTTSQVSSTEADVASARAGISAARQQFEAAKAQRDQAQLNQSYTTVTAAQPGRVVNLSAAVGQFAQPGTNLTMFVPDQIWVTANFKEIQLDRMRPGEPVTLEIDAYPERAIRGHVGSVQPGSGTAFSLLPAQNATGNYVKIVQRVPVKIVMDDPPTDVALGPGMSVVPTVRIDPTPSLFERLRGWL